jgi:hypothetical protein
MDIYIIECTHHKYSCNQPCLTLLTSCNLITCDNYITTKVYYSTQSTILLQMGENTLKCTTKIHHKSVIHSIFLVEW